MYVICGVYAPISQSLVVDEPTIKMNWNEKKKTVQIMAKTKTESRKCHSKMWFCGRSRNGTSDSKSMTKCGFRFFFFSAHGLPKNDSDAAVQHSHVNHLFTWHFINVSTSIHIFHHLFSRLCLYVAAFKMISDWVIINEDLRWWMPI